MSETRYKITTKLGHRFAADFSVDMMKQISKAALQRAMLLGQLSGVEPEDAHKAELQQDSDVFRDLAILAGQLAAVAERFEEQVAAELTT